MDLLNEECGVFGVYLPNDQAARTTFFGIFSLQHRGQESAGIATSDLEKLYLHKDMGLVSRVFDEGSLSSLPGPLAIGHTRYSTTGSSYIANAQPLHIDGEDTNFFIAHNGNVTNAKPLRKDLESQGITFHSSTDTEVIGQLISTAQGESFPKKIQAAMRRLQGAYSLVLLTHDSVYAVRDPLAIRPLCYGKIEDGWAVASESCALDHVSATLEGELAPGEIIVLNESGIERHPWDIPVESASCIFEYIYFARPDSILGNHLVYPTRQEMGAQLAREHPVEADLVTYVPDSAMVAGNGYALESGIPFAETLVKNRYVGRTFIKPDQNMRDEGVRLKFNPLPEIIRGKRLIVVDDSIVRGTTNKHVVELLRAAGAKEVHLRVCSPPIKSPCHFGIDMPNRWELIAAEKSVDEIAEIMGVDSLGYLSIDGLKNAIGRGENGYCDACFTGNYPLPIQLEMSKLDLEKD